MSIKPYVGLLIVLLITAIPLFAHLDDISLLVWDESRLANNAIEMYETNNYLVVTFDYKPEMWSTKPPFLIWMQVLSMKLFGINDLAFRLPSALSGLFTCVFLLWFFDRKLNLPWLGILSAIILITVPDYVMLHGTRTGDYDATLVLFMTLYACCFFLYIEENNKKYFWLTVLFLILAALTKGVAGVLFLPAILVYSLYRRKLLTILRMTQFYLGLFLFLFFVVGYYVLREQYNPGYIQAVINNELGGRYLKTLEGKAVDGPLFYYDLLIGWCFKPWYWVLPLGIAAGLFLRDKKIKDLSIFMLMIVVTFFIIISFSSTKLHWYMQPVFPFLCIFVAILFHHIFQRLYQWNDAESFPRLNIWPYLFLFIVLIEPYASKINVVFHPTGNHDYRAATDMADVLKGFSKKQYPYKERMQVFYEDYHSELKWYLKVFKHQHLPIATGGKDDLLNGDLALTYQDDIKSLIESKYVTHIVNTHGAATLYQIHGKK